MTSKKSTFIEQGMLWILGTQIIKDHTHTHTHTHTLQYCNAHSNVNVLPSVSI